MYINNKGNRIVGEGFQKQFRPYWSTTVHKNFIRLTPDRQSKTGALFSHKAIRKFLIYDSQWINAISYYQYGL